MSMGIAFRGHPALARPGGSRFLAAAAWAALVLAACGGGGSGSAGPGSTGPGSAGTVQVALASTGPARVTPAGAVLVTASVAGAAGGLAWSVDGVPGGDARTGTVVAPLAGLAAVYQAPAESGTHTITAASLADPAAAASLTVAVAAAMIQPSDFAVVDVRAYGAAGDGVRDDTAAIQRAVDAVAGTGKAVLVPDGTYLVDPAGNRGAGIVLASDMGFLMEAGAVLVAKPTATAHYQVVRVAACRNVVIRGGTIRGNNGNNSIATPTTTEDGNGLQIVASDRVVVEATTVEDCFCDGVYVGRACTDIVLNGVTARANRRNGMSVTDAAGVAIIGCTFDGNTGSVETAGGPVVNGSGLDLEPNAGEAVRAVLVAGSRFRDNQAAGLTWGIGLDGAATSQVFALGNSVSGNSTGIGAVHCRDSVILGNTVAGNSAYGIYVHHGADTTVVRGNLVTGTGSAGDRAGIECYLDRATTVDANSSSGNPAFGILSVASADPTITGNTCNGNGVAGVRVSGATGTVIVAGNLP